MNHDDDIQDAVIIDEEGNVISDEPILVENEAQVIEPLWSLIGNHLQNRLTPAVPMAMIDACIEAITNYNNGEKDSIVELPEGALYKGNPFASSEAIVKGHHLWDWILVERKRILIKNDETGEVLFDGFVDDLEDFHEASPGEDARIVERAQAERESNLGERVKCSKCFIEYDKGEMLFDNSENLDNEVEAGLAFCVMCGIPEGNPPSI